MSKKKAELSSDDVILSGLLCSQREQLDITKDTVCKLPT